MCLKLNYQILTTLVTLAALTAGLVNCDRQASAGRRIQGAGSFKSPCGSAEEVSSRIGDCLKPIFELVEGRYNDPKGDNDIQGHCQRFNSTERCIRIISKDCLSGLHKTAVSAVASATKRFRTAECKNEVSRARYLDPLKCARSGDTGKLMAKMFMDYTSMIQTARDMPIAPETKLIKVCCALVAMDKDISKIFDNACPAHTSVVLRIVHAMTDDARSTLCINPKCAGALDGLVPTNLKQDQNFIEPIMQVLFQLTDS